MKPGRLDWKTLAIGVLLGVCVMLARETLQSAPAAQPATRHPSVSNPFPLGPALALRSGTVEYSLRRL